MRAVVAAVAVAIATFGAAAPARAADQLGLSYDGVHWASSLRQPLFQPSIRWVPGDVRSRTFYVRVQSDPDDSGDLTVDVARDGREALADSGYLQISARAGDGPWSSIQQGGLQELLDADDLSAGSVTPVEVRVELDPQAPNGTMVLATDLDFHVTLADARTGTDGGTGDNGSDGSDSAHPGGDLASTGNDVPPWLPPVALLLIASGAVLVARHRTPLREET